ncbi:MAG TPA: type VI secretion system contractile sheath large subunit [Paracoccaceae bacterium]|nr:type VI secretion system contractile sheath large subunit [Paracoccaceae bacterium]
MAEETAADPQGAQGATGEIALDEFEALLEKRFEPRSDAAKEEVGGAVRALAGFLEGVMEEQRRKNLPQSSIRAIRAMIAEIDRLMSDQMNEILHHPKFQALEGSWRGLRFLCERTETGVDLKIRVMNVKKKELSDELSKYQGIDWDQSPLFAKVYTDGYGVLNGDPYGCLVGDYHFDHTGPDVDLLNDVSKIAAASHAPFMTGVSPNLFDADDWEGVVGKRDLAEITARPTHIAWNALREKDDSRYIGLAGPRMLARRAYGENNPVDAFDFVEETGGNDATKFCWSNSAYAMAANITRAFKLYGWCARIRGVESGGLQDELPTHVFQADSGEFDSQCPTEVQIDDRREAEMARLGLMPLVHMKGTNKAAFIGAQSMHNPPRFEDNAAGQLATSNAMLGARLPYIFACSRFAHFLKHMVRNKIGSYMERDDMEKWLGNWISNYVELSDNASEYDKAKKPLKAAEVVVEEDPENPGMYDAKFFLRPHYQLEGANISLRLVSKLPSEAGA